ncbi:MAG: putative DNA binding domain-containing protein [Pirellulales bacterium]
MTKKIVKWPIPARESDKVEFKLPGADVTSLAAVACAFLNSEGGRLYVGVDDNGSVVGVDDAEKFAATLRSRLQELVTPKALWSVNIDRVDDKDVVTVEVPQGEDRPYVCKGAIYVRRGSHTTAAESELIRQLVEKRHLTTVRWERQPASGFELSDVDEAEISKSVEDIRRRERFELPESVETSNVLHELALLDSGVLTNAGAVLFARNVCRQLPQARVRATVFSTDKGGDFTDNQVFEGHAFFLLGQLTSFIGGMSESLPNLNQDAWNVPTSLNPLRSIARRSNERTHASRLLSVRWWDVGRSLS